MKERDIMAHVRYGFKNNLTPLRVAIASASALGICTHHLMRIVLQLCLLLPLLM